jgi:circadian clock protein KaiC
MPERDLVRTGVYGLDAILGGGIPRGNIILAEGAVGTGKTTLGLEFIYRGATEFDEPGLIVLFEVSPDKIVRDAAMFGWELPQLEERGRLKIIFTTRQVFYQELQQADSLLLDEAAQIGARRIFVDGIGHQGVITNGMEPRQAFHVLAEGLQRENLSAMLGLETVPREEARQASAPPEEFIADTVMLLRMEPLQRGAIRSLEIIKSRGHDFGLGRHSLRIVEGKGIEVYRRVQAPRDIERQRAAAFQTTRIPSGTPGLDPLVGGGFWVGGALLVVGVSGVGKSVMGLQYLAEGVRQQEKSLMVALDEPAAQVLRNAGQIGLDLESAIARDALRIWHDSPQELEIDRHFAQLEEMVRTFQPQRVVIDSLSTYSSTLGNSDRSFRDSFHALVLLMKQHQVTVIYNFENPQMLGMSSMMGEFSLSSLVDTIILLNWVELGDTMRPALTVAKMRGSPISRNTHEYEIIDGRGLQVLPRAVPGVVPSLPFTGYYGLLSRAPERHPQGTSAAVFDDGAADDK